MIEFRIIHHFVALDVIARSCEKKITQGNYKLLMNSFPSIFKCLIFTAKICKLDIFPNNLLIWQNWLKIMKWWLYIPCEHRIRTFDAAKHNSTQRMGLLDMAPSSNYKGRTLEYWIIYEQLFCQYVFVWKHFVLELNNHG